MCYSAQITAAYQKLIRMTGNPAPADLTALWRLFDGKWQPFYEHKLAE